MSIVFPPNSKSLYSISLSANKMVTIVRETIMLSKRFSGEWVTCPWTQKCGAVVHSPGVMMTHCCERVLACQSRVKPFTVCRFHSKEWQCFLSLSPKPPQRGATADLPQLSSSGHSAGHCLMNSVWQLIFNGDKVIDPGPCYKSYTCWVEEEQTHLCHSTQS